MIVFLKKKNIPLIVVAASCKQTEYTTFAKCLFYSHLCNPVFDYYSTLKEGKDYNLAYLSSEHGLLPSDAVVEPYNEFLTPNIVEKITNDSSRQKAGALFDIYDPSEVVLACPEMHVNFFKKLLPEATSKTIVHEPEGNYGILQLRTLLSHHLECYKAKSIRVFMSFMMEKDKETAVCLELFIGDKIDCLVDTISGQLSVNNDVVISEINTEKNIFYCQDGSRYDQLSVKNGLKEEEILVLKKFSKPFKLGSNMSSIGITLQALRNEVSRQKSAVKCA